MTSYTNHEIPLNDMVPEEFQTRKYRGQLNALLNKKAEINRLNGKDDRDIYIVKTLVEGDMVIVNGLGKDAEKFAAAVKATNWK